MGVYATDAVIAVLLTVAVLPVAMIPILGTTVRRFGTLHGWPLVAAIGLVGAAAVLAAFTVFPLPDPESLVCTSEQWRDYWRLNPVTSFSQIVTESPGFPAVLWSQPMLQVVLNVILFVPYGFFLHQVTRWRTGVVVAVGALTSLLIEVTQGTAFYGAYECPYRLFDTSDLIVNTAGAAVGVAASTWAIRRLPWVSPERSPDLSRVRLRRRVWATLVDVVLVVFLFFFVHAAALAVAHATVGAREWSAWASERAWVTLAFQFVPAMMIGLVVPALRRDRATPGQAVLFVAPVPVDDPAHFGGARALWGRFFARWFWWGLIPFFGAVLLAFAEVVVAWRRHDSRSLAGVAGGTVTRSRPAIHADREAGASI
jgi:glycopeptide antibiotics resistance protein